MGCWGMGITQSDEYCEVYERFIDEYDEGRTLFDIKKDILDEYLAEFEEEDGVLHNVYFAIGKAEWMCGGISKEIFDKISHIVKTDANITYYRELEATESDLKLRRKNLEKFLKVLSVPREKTRKRNSSFCKYAKNKETNHEISFISYTVDTKEPFPAFNFGDVFAYRVNGKYRLFSLVRSKLFASYTSFCYVWAELYEQIPSVNMLFDEPVFPLGHLTAKNFPSMDKLELVANLPDMTRLDGIYPGTIYKPWLPAAFATANEKNLCESYPPELCLKLSECLKRIPTPSNKTIEELMVMISSTEEFFDQNDVVSDDTIIKELNMIEDIAQTDRDGMNLLMSAALNNRPKIIEYLFKRGVDINSCDNNGNTALHFAVQSNTIDVIRILINNGANINAADNNGNSPLVRCTYATPLTVFQALIDNGADPYLKNNYGMCALDVDAAREDIMNIIKPK